MPKEDRRATKALRRAAKGIQRFYTKPVNAGSVLLREHKMAMKQVNNTNSMVRMLGVHKIRDSKTQCSSAKDIYKERFEEDVYEVNLLKKTDVQDFRRSRTAKCCCNSCRRCYMMLEERGPRACCQSRRRSGKLKQQVIAKQGISQ